MEQTEHRAARRCTYYDFLWKHYDGNDPVHGHSPYQTWATTKKKTQHICTSFLLLVSSFTLFWPHFIIDYKYTLIVSYEIMPSSTGITT